jgi:uncharacterized protein YbaR (Trm112 family)
MALDPILLEIIVCPEDKGELVYLEAEHVLFNSRLRRTYPVRDDIPVLLIEEATTLDDDEFDRLSALAQG